MLRTANRLFLFGFLFWLGFNVIQAIFLHLDPDEAYYWMYAQQLDWGYFDHPPIIALLIKFGSVFIPGSLGVRLGAILLFVGTLYLLWCLVDKPKEKRSQYHFLLLAAAMPFLHVYGFVSTPDSPLLFFTALFFLAYRNFITDPSWRNTFGLGLVMAALLYSKYHGVLLIFFTLLSNWRLLLQPRFYVASLFGALLYFPHLYWQYVHDFPTFRYHLAGRNDTYELKYTYNYLSNQLFLFSPFLFPFIVRAISIKPQDLLERAFYFVIAGFWLFFLYSSFKGNVEPQWTAVLCIPFVILLYRRYLLENWKESWLIRMAVTTTVILFSVRLFFLLPLPQIRTHFNQAAWVPELAAELKEEPIVFIDSYRDPSIYSFYAGQRAYTYTDIFYRLNQFDLWDHESRLHDQDVYLIGPADWSPPDGQSWEGTRKRFTVTKVEKFQVTNKLRMEWLEIPEYVQQGDTIITKVRLINPYHHAINFQQGDNTMRFSIQLDGETEHLQQVDVELQSALLNIKTQDTLDLVATFVVPQLELEEVKMSFCLENQPLRPAYISPKYLIKIR